MLEREHRSRIFEKILKDMEESTATKRATPGQVAAALEKAPDELNTIRLKAERAAQHGDHATAAQEFERALRLAAHYSGSNPIGLIELHLAHAANLEFCGDFKGAGKALDLAQGVLDSGASISMLDQQVRIEEARGFLCFITEDTSGAETHYTKAVEFFERSGVNDPIRLAQLRSELGAVYTQVGLFDKALGVVVEAVANLETAPGETSEQSMRLFKQLANIAFRKSEPNAAVNHLLEAYRHAQLVDCPTEMIELEVTLATVYTQHGEYETARQWYEAAILRHEKLDTTARWPLSLLYSSLALVQARNEETEASIDCFAKSLDLQLTHLAVAPTPKQEPREGKSPAS